MKIGLLATVTPEGLPHVSLISSLMACVPEQMCFGQFTEGTCKKNILTNPKVGFLIMSLNKEMWRGKASYTHLSKEGPEFDYYNNVPMFRYNAYFGVHTVYYLDLVSQTGKHSPPDGQGDLRRGADDAGPHLGQKAGNEQVLNGWTRGFLEQVG